MQRRATLFASLALVALAVLVYARTLHDGPIVDDRPMALDNPYVESWAGLPALFSHDLWTTSGQHEAGKIYRPFFMVSCVVNRSLGGGSVESYHAGNLFIHIAACLALFQLLLVAVGRAHWMLASLAVAWFTVGGIESEAVAWISGRCDSLGAAFAVGALLAHRSRQRGRAFTTALLAACALLTKESFIVLPALLFADDLLVIRRPLRGEWPTYALLVGSIGFYFCVRSFVGLPDASVIAGTSPVALAQSFLYLVFDHGTRFIWPYRFGFMEPYRPLPLWGSLAVTGAIALATWNLVRLARRKRPDLELPRAALFGWLWFLFSLLPLALTGPNLHLVGDRYAYFPLMGLTLSSVALVAMLLDRFPGPAGSPRLGFLAVGLLAVTLQAARTWQRLGDWRSEETLFRASLRTDPDDFFALYFLGKLAAERGQLAEAEPMLRRSLTLEPDQFRADNALCFVYLQMDRLGEAEANCRESLTKNPGDPRTWVNLASLYVRGAHWHEGLAAATHAAEQKPGYAEAHYLSAVCLANLGRLEPAQTELERTLQLDPNHAGAKSLAAQLKQAAATP
jgi:tetratricopeptide (TPR) repeat protein